MCTSLGHPVDQKQEPVLVFSGAVQLRGVDDRALLLCPAGPRRRGGRVPLDGHPGQHLLPAALGQHLPVQPGRQPRVPRGQALPRAVLADPGAGRGHRQAALRHLRAQAAGPRPGADRQAGHLDRRAHRRPPRPRRRDQPVARGLRGARRGLGQPRPADGRVDRHPARPGGRRLLRVPRHRSSTCRRSRSRRCRPNPFPSSSAATPTPRSAAPPASATAGCTAGETPRTCPASWPAWPDSAPRKAPKAARSRCT